MVNSPSTESRRKRHHDDDRHEHDVDRKSSRRHRSSSRDREKDDSHRRRSDRDTREHRDRDKRRDRRDDHYRRDEDRRTSRRDESSNRRRRSPTPEAKPVKAEENGSLEMSLRAQQQLQKAIAEGRAKLAGQATEIRPPALGSLTVPNKNLKPSEASLYYGLRQSVDARIAGLLPSIKTDGKKEEKSTDESKAEAGAVPATTYNEADDLEAIDPRISLRGPQRAKRLTFKFVKPGEYQKQANIQRNQARRNMLQAEIESTVSKQTGISTAVKLALVTPDVDQGSANYLPPIEWWDEHVLQSKSYEAIPASTLEESTRYAKTITHLIEHPIQLKAPDEPVVQPLLKVYLTKKERKKLRRQNRREHQKEEMEKVRLGLLPPPEPKVKIGNLMKVLGTDAIQDPTKMEAHVREQMANRMKKHLQANAERKLTKQEKSEKKHRKIAEDTSLNVHVSIYRVKSLFNPSFKFKVETNAKQLEMTGCVCIYKDINLVVVEGGPKQQKFYRNLMLTRIKWSEEVVGSKGRKKRADNDDESDDEDAPREMNDCQLVWEGIVRNRAFSDMRVQLFQSPKLVREFLDKHGVGHYWDHAYSTSVLLNEEPEA